MLTGWMDDLGKIHRELDQSSKPLLATTTMGSAQYDDNVLNLNSSLPGVAGIWWTD